MKVAMLARARGSRVITAERSLGGYPGLCTLFGEAFQVSWHDLAEGLVAPDILKGHDLIWWEWDRNGHAPQAAIVAREQNPKAKIICFTGVLDMFWDKIEPKYYKAHWQAIAATDAIAVYNMDEVSFYEVMFPDTKAFHCPCAIDLEHVRSYRAKPNPDKMLLSFHANIWSDDNRKTAVNVGLFQSLLEHYPNLKATLYCRHDEPAAIEEHFRGLGWTGCKWERPVDWPFFLEDAADAYLSCHIFSRRMHSQWSVVAAAIGVPVVGPSHCQTHRSLWPELHAPWYHLSTLRDRCLWLLSDLSVREAVCDHAWSQVQCYSLDRARSRIRRAVGL